MNITPHFLGAVVLEPQAKEGLMGVDTLHIIDGQQRLTTLQYVLASLLLALRATGIPAFEPSVIGCMQNNNEETMRDPKMERYKLWPTFRDRPHFIKTLGIERLEDFRSEYPAHFTPGAPRLYAFSTADRYLRGVWCLAESPEPN